MSTPDNSQTTTLTASELPLPLSVLLQADGTLTFGTCSHCVTRELTRPERAWDADAQRSELDFDQAGIFAALVELGVEIEIEAEYVCP